MAKGGRRFSLRKEAEAVDKAVAEALERRGHRVFWGQNARPTDGQPRRADGAVRDRRHPILSPTIPSHSPVTINGHLSYTGV
jgi:hypothetical protein